MAQQVINISNIGDPAVQTGFTQTNQNFNQIWLAGPVGSNIQIIDNTIQSINLNGNINLNTHGIGVVVPAADIIPDQGNVRMLGSGFKPFNTVYTQYFTATSGTVTGNLYVPGNLLVSGNTIYVNRQVLNLGNATINLSANAAYPALADGSGIHVHSAGADFTWSAITNTWNSNLPIMAPAFIGDGSQLTNVSAIVDSSAITGSVLGNTILYSNVVTVGTLTELSVTGNINTPANITGNVITAQFLYGDGSNITRINGNAIIGATGNTYFANIAGTAETANLAAVATHAINADTAVTALTATQANTALTADFAQLANVANVACIADVANSAAVAGMAVNVGVLSTITVTGNVLAGNVTTGNVTGTVITASQPYITGVGTLGQLSIAGNVNTTNIYANSYYYANGTPFIGGGGPGNYSNANVAAYLPVYSGSLNTVYNLSAYGNVGFANTVTVGNSLTSSSVFSDNYYYSNGAPINTTQGVFGDQQFYGYGITGPYQLAFDTNNNNVIVTINGLTQAPGAYYNIVNSTITFTDPVEVTDLVDIRYLGQGSTTGDQQITGNGASTYSLIQSATGNSIILTINGLTQTPGQGYNVSGNVLTFTDPLTPEEYVDIRFLAEGNTGGFNWLANTITFNDGTVQSTAYQVVTPPGSSVGQPGDVEGMVAYDTTYWYWCTGDYDGVSAIWSSASNGGGSPSNYGNANVAAYLPTYTGNITSSNMSASNTIVATGNITAGNVSAVGIVTATTYYGDGSNLTGITGGGAAEASFSIQSADFAATAGNRYGVDTTGGSVTATLPATPATGQAVFFADAGGAYATNNFIVDPNGQTIMGTSGTMTVSTDNQSVGLFYNGTTWRTYNAG